MKQLVLLASIVLFFGSCKNNPGKIVSAIYVDSMIKNYIEPPAIKSNADELEFWKKRIVPANPGITNEFKYAAALAGRYLLSGDIHDILRSDSILYTIDRTYNHKEAAPCISLMAHAILQHRFSEADSLLETAKKIGIKPYESISASFDVDFELGRYNLAEGELKKMFSVNDYGYEFRLSKLAHYKGELDTAIAAMTRAAEIAGNELTLKQAALSNTADLYLHNDQLQQAYDFYRRSIALNAADLHSIMGLGWIALVHDKNDSLAERIFSFVLTRTMAPDPLFKLVQVAMDRGDSITAVQYARKFELTVTDSSYGKMYDKYLIELYTGILHQPDNALRIAKSELMNRNTPQTNAWYVWSLLSAGKKDEAYKVFLDKVSGKPLEGLDLYWMGKLMLAIDKGYNATQFFKAAWKNRYDLNPVSIRDIEQYTENL